MVKEELQVLVPRLVRMSAHLRKGDFDAKSLADDLDTAVSMLGLAMAIEWKLSLIVRGDRVAILEPGQIERRVAQPIFRRAA